MRIDTRCKATTLGDASHGALLMATLGRLGTVRGLKAFRAAPDGARTDFFVTVGPFVSEHGVRPVVYIAKDHSAALAVDVTDGYRLVPSLRPEDVSMSGDEASWTPGKLLLRDGGVLMAVANFGRAGPQDMVALDLATGEITDLPEPGELIATDRWTIQAEGDGAAGPDFEFAADSAA